MPKQGDAREASHMRRTLLSPEAGETDGCAIQRMEIVGQLTGGVIHDFNNILTVIIGTIEILAEAVAGQPDLEAVAKLMGEAAARGTSLTSHLLAFARGKPSEPRDVDVNALLGDAARLLRPTLGGQIEVEIAPASTGSSSFALLDPSRFMAAIFSLAILARDAMPEGGKISFAIRNAASKPCNVDEQALVAHDVIVEVDVTCHGSGGFSGPIEKIRELFGQTNSDVESCGETAMGSSIRIYLPRAVGGLQRQPENFIRSGKGTILIVENDVLVRKYVLAQVQSLGYRTLAAVDASEALAILDQDEAIDLMFTDVVLPGRINGRRLATEAKNRRPSLKVLFTSGYAEIHSGRLDPEILLLAKPYLKTDLAKMIRTALAA
jgi:CheY-like chemotaxis protein